MKSVIELVTRRPALVAWTAGFIVAGTLLYFLVTALLMPDIANTVGPPTITMQKIQGQGERGNQLGWKFEAESADTSTDGTVTTYHNVHRAIYYLKGKPAYRLTANEVTLDLRSQNYSASGNVHVWSVRSRDLSDLKSDNVMWNNPMQTLTCPTRVHVVYHGYDLVTTHLEANLLTGSSTLGGTQIRSNGG